jgi:hypothetical protein
VWMFISVLIGSSFPESSILPQLSNFSLLMSHLVQATSLLSGVVSTTTIKSYLWNIWGSV